MNEKHKKESVIWVHDYLFYFYVYLFIQCNTNSTKMSLELFSIATISLILYKAIIVNTPPLNHLINKSLSKHFL